jgi:hypothetical protein
LAEILELDCEPSGVATQCCTAGAESARNIADMHALNLAPILRVLLYMLLTRDALALFRRQ